MDVLDIILKWAIPFLCTTIASACIAYAKGVRAKNKKEADALRGGLQSLLRAEIIRAHDKYTARGFCPVYARESLDKAYAAYYDLKGENIITDLYNDLKKLPNTDPSAREAQDKHETKVVFNVANED